MKKNRSVLLGTITALALAGATAQAQQADLVGQSFTLKTQGHSGRALNATLTVANQGDADANNSVVQFWLSADDVLSTDTDTMFHQVSLGTVKAGKTTKRTLGGGLFRNLNPSGMRIIAVIDALDQVPESNEDNNVIVSDPLP